MVSQVTKSYAEIYEWGNLYTAFRKAAKGKRSRVAAATFEFRLEDNLIALQDELAKENYHPGPYTHFTIHEPKRRLISAAPFRDRVVHHALCRQIEPTFEASFIHHSYANRIGKGTHRALDTCQKWMCRYQYVLPCDIQHFFSMIDHNVLKRTLYRRIQDGRIRRLISRILASGEGIEQLEDEVTWFHHDNLFSINRSRGLPIGNLTSQFWANCYMNEFDHFVKRELRCKAYLRYVDDFLLFADDKATLWRWRAAIIERLAQMRLKLHETKAQVRPTTEGCRFLGFMIYPDFRLLLRRKGVAYQRRLSENLYAHRTGRIDRESFEDSLLGWINHVRYANTWGLRRSMLANVRL